MQWNVLPRVSRVYKDEGGTILVHPSVYDDKISAKEELRWMSRYYLVQWKLLRRVVGEMNGWKALTATERREDGRGVYKAAAASRQPAKLKIWTIRDDFS